jgi:hypothetical protein
VIERISVMAAALASENSLTNPGKRAMRLSLHDECTP